MIAWTVLLFFLPLILVAAIVIPLLARGRRARAPVGTGRRIVGAALIVLSAAGILGGQLFATRRPGEAEDPRIPVIPSGAAGEFGSGRIYVRFLTLDTLEPDRPRLVEQAELRLDGTGYDRQRAQPAVDVVPSECRVDLRTDGRWSEIGLQLGAGPEWVGATGAMTGELTRRETVLEGRHFRRPGVFATFTDAAFPPAIHGRTVVLVDPIPERTELVPFREAMAGRTGDRILEALDREDHSVAARWEEFRGGPGLPGLASALSLFAIGMLLLGGLGSVLVGRRTGAWLAVYVMLAPLLLVAADRIAFVRHRDALADESSSVRASAMLGLRASPFFAQSGRRIVEEIAAREPDIGERDLARAALDIHVAEYRPAERKNLFTGEDLLALERPESRP